MLSSSSRAYAMLFSCPMHIVARLHCSSLLFAVHSFSRLSVPRLGLILSPLLRPSFQPQSSARLPRTGVGSSRLALDSFHPISVYSVSLSLGFDLAVFSRQHVGSKASVYAILRWVNSVLYFMYLHMRARISVSDVQCM